MTEDRELSAIMFTDIVGYTSLMGKDEAKALQILEQEADFLPGIRKRTQMRVQLLDDPLMRQDEYRVLAGPAETDVTNRYATG